MKKLKVLVWLLATLSATAVVYANLNGPSPGYTGAPGEATCSVAGCHEMPRGGVGVDVYPSGPQHTDTVAYELLLSGPLVRDWGFQLTVLDSLDQPFGEILVVDSVRTKVITGPSGRSYLSHTAAGVPGGSCNCAFWYFRWVRPSGAAITTPIYFYVSGMAADGDGTTANDAVVTSLSVGPFCKVQPPAGDVNGSHTVTSADAIHLVGYIFKGGNPPVWCPAAGDVNCDVSITAADIIFLVNFVFKSGPAPCDVCPLIIDGTWAC